MRGVWSPALRVADAHDHRASYPAPWSTSTDGRVIFDANGIPVDPATACQMVNWMHANMVERERNTASASSHSATVVRPREEENA
jgi:hypothetical protein